MVDTARCRRAPSDRTPPRLPPRALDPLPGAVLPPELPRARRTPVRTRPPPFLVVGPRSRRRGPPSPSNPHPARPADEPDADVHDSPRAHAPAPAAPWDCAAGRAIVRPVCDGACRRSVPRCAGIPADSSVRAIGMDGMGRHGGRLGARGRAAPIAGREDLHRVVGSGVPGRNRLVHSRVRTEPKP